MGKFKEDLGLALELAGHADVVTMHRFEASDLSVKEKPDMSPYRMRTSPVRSKSANPSSGPARAMKCWVRNTAARPAIRAASGS